jgi:hypothetical protein
VFLGRDYKTASRMSSKWKSKADFRGWGRAQHPHRHVTMLARSHRKHRAAAPLSRKNVGEEAQK